MSGRLRIGVIGGGLIAQVEHIPNLVQLRERFELRGVCDPSPGTRAWLAARYAIAAVATPAELFALGLDAVVVASPDALHTEHVLAALAAGLHVFCEKPLCYDPADAGRIAAARDAARRVVQLGYMKRFDPSYEAVLELLPRETGALRHVSVEINDPDSAPFVAHHPYLRFDDVPADLIAATRAAQRAQLRAGTGIDLDARHYRAATNPFCSSLVHDVNLVHGLLERIGIGATDIAIVSAQAFAGGDGGAAQLSLRDGAALWTMSHLALPGVADYRERIALYFTDAIFELVFPSPYLNHQPTELWHQRSTGDRSERTRIRVGYAEPFLRELLAFHDAVVSGGPVRNTVEQAGRDISLLTAIAARAQRLHTSSERVS